MKTMAADIDIVAYGVAKNVKSTQLATFLESKGLKVVDCVLLTTYEQVRSLSYKITIKAKDFEKSQDPATWPYRISFRPFINRSVKITRQNESKSATTGQNFRQYNSNVQKDDIAVDKRILTENGGIKVQDETITVSQMKVTR